MFELDRQIAWYFIFRQRAGCWVIKHNAWIGIDDPKIGCILPRVQLFYIVITKKIAYLQKNMAWEKSVFRAL